VTLDVQSPKFRTKPVYQFCDGYLPRLVNVTGFDGVLIHVGNTAKDTEGCLLVGKNTKVGKVLESRQTFVKLYGVLLEGKSEGIYITIE
jgi:hypothetical protein